MLEWIYDKFLLLHKIRFYIAQESVDFTSYYWLVLPTIV